MKYQNFFSTDENFDSPRINEAEKNYYTDYAISKKSESGETLEIRLFGRKVSSLTINEALYIINIKNYEQDYKSFRYNFNNCNYNKTSDLIDESLKQTLIGLNISINDIINGKNILYSLPNSIKENKAFMFAGKSFYHPPQFYYQDNDLNSIKKISEIIKQL